MLLISLSSPNMNHLVNKKGECAPYLLSKQSVGEESIHCSALCKRGFPQSVP